MPTCEERVDTLESIWAQSILNNDEARIRSERELSAFKEQMKAINEKADKDRQRHDEEMKAINEKADKDRQRHDEAMKAYFEKADKERQAFTEKSDKEIQAFTEKSDKERQAFIEKSDMEIQAFKELSMAKIQESREDMRIFNENMQAAFKRSDKAMQEFRDKMDNYKKEQEKEHKEMNKQWGGLARKMGTIVEDLIAPAIRPAIKQYFNCDAIFVGERILKRLGSDSFEVDLLAYCEDMVFYVEVRSTPQARHVDEINENTGLFYKYFPEYKDKKLIKIFASIVFPENVLRYASKKGLYFMAFREWEYVDILNFEEIEKAS